MISNQLLGGKLEQLQAVKELKIKPGITVSQFGQAEWLVGKVSLTKISVNYEACIACMKFADDSPSTVMRAILKQDKKTILDCFACYSCREVCPTNSIRFSTQRRTLPPRGHFSKRSKNQHI